ncbi:AmpG family muropeptide MFS transporter [Anaeromyxobacter paludicola]|uniref:Integral membrane signal transducer protein n=1 Tax=Anaeromyxobacter paludicola TaxID=2918171 RepID=A0ABM7X5E6_9BACT|nr:MFS transporter [Anaeromyxobacter paludicola]BDG07042.1 integral membrane signal transducer protein [Anaeromyxobacter paludicola]
MAFLKNRRVQVVGLLSLASGMPLGWTFTTLQFWLVSLGIPKGTIGLLSAVSLPWSLKFLWSPLVDRYALPWPGRRRSWVVLSQLALAAMFGVLALYALRLSGLRDAGAPLATPAVAATVGLLALGVTFLSATQDIAYDAYCVEALHPDEQGPASGLKVMYYRLGMLVAGALAVSASDWLPWPVLFGILALLFAAFTGVTLLAPEPERPAAPPRSLARAVWEPLAAFFRRPGALTVLLFLVLYKYGDNLAGTMVNPFLKDLCFRNAEAGAAVKTLGTVATIAGAGLGAAVMSRIGLGRALWIFGLLQAGANLLYAGAALSRGAPMDVALCASLPPLSAATRAWVYVAIASEWGAQGMATSALLALILRACDKRYSATQYALLSSLFGLGRTLSGIPSGYLAQRLGYPAFFALAVAAAVPGLLLLQRIAPLGQREVPGAEAQPEA